jgi:AbrB family looped-hinge helix DNA binding protein
MTVEVSTAKNEICRRVDNVGRIVIPVSFRKKLDICPGDEMRARLDPDGCLVLKKIRARQCD